MLINFSVCTLFAALAISSATAQEDGACQWAAIPSIPSSTELYPTASNSAAMSSESSLPTTSLTTLVTMSSAPSLPAAASSSVFPTAVASSTAAGSSASVSTSATSATVSGDGTWYGESCGEQSCWEGGACAFVDYVLPASIAGSTCVSELIWNSSYHCGGCVSIEYQGKKKIAMITNKTGGDAVHLDMSPDMFAQLADKSLGGISIQWAHVPCPITSPLEIRMHGGASQYWFAATVENAILRTAAMEVSSNGGSTWQATTRNINNFFELASGGTGTTTAWVRVTSETGTQVVVKNVNMASSTVTTASSNYA